MTEKKNGKYLVTFGGWYQRTTLHLSEVYGFLAEGYSKLDLPKEKLADYWGKLNIDSVSREADYLEFVKAETDEGIEIRYYEDGLYVLQFVSEDIKESRDLLENYFNNNFLPAIDFLFSLGAPTPKILANMKISHPYVAGVIDGKPDDFSINEGVYGKVYSKMSSFGVTVYKTSKYIFVVTTEKNHKLMQDLIEMQIFFREFKDQLERYLDIHRKVWEEISQIRERRYVRGRKVEFLSTQLENYEKTINLINSRINQMGNYVNTRASAAKKLEVDGHLVDLFQFKFETLADTHSYIKELWSMTKEYLKTAMEVIRDIQGKNMNNSIRSIQLLASIGVISGLLGYLSRDSLPAFTLIGISYFLLLIFTAWVINYFINQYYRNKKFQITFAEKDNRI
ncbi:MAG: hypothetical protein C4584_00610 [Armatimonadetes bacterium]|nr:MAG: hypothetical protein C4584_00610 [Armatimonadota bacterium]